MISWKQLTCFTYWFNVVFQCMIEVLTLYNDLFSSLWVDLKIVLELWNKGNIWNTSLTQTTQTSKHNWRESRELDLRTGITVNCRKQAIESNAEKLWPLIIPESSELMHITPGKSRKTQQSAVILDLCLRKTWSGKYHDYRDRIIFEKLRLQNDFHLNSKPAFSNSYGLKNVFKKLRSSGLEIKLFFSNFFSVVASSGNQCIPPAHYRQPTIILVIFCYFAQKDTCHFSLHYLNKAIHGCGLRSSHQAFNLGSREILGFYC